MSLSRRRMMYGLVGMAGMTHKLTALHAHHHAPRFGKCAAQASTSYAPGRKAPTGHAERHGLAAQLSHGLAVGAAG